MDLARPLAVPRQTGHIGQQECGDEVIHHRRNTVFLGANTRVSPNEYLYRPHNLPDLG